MYRVNCLYNERAFKEGTFKSYDEAVEEARSQAEKDWEGCYYEVSEIRSVHKADPIKHPVISAVVTEETFTKAIEIKETV